MSDAMDGDDRGSRILRISASWIAIALTSLFGAFFLHGLSVIGKRGFFGDILYFHVATLVGLPCAALASLALVLLLRTVAGDIALKVLGIEFKGASGPIIMWVLCFLTIVFAIKSTWTSEAKVSNGATVRSE